MSNLPQNRKCIIVLDNASYHSRLKFKTPSMSMNVQHMLSYMRANNITIPNPVPIKALLLKLIKDACIQKRYIIDDIALSYGHEVLRLPPYHCCFSPIELVWAKLKSQVRKRNTTPSLSASVCQHLRDCASDIDAELWKKMCSTY
ncbi:hypothetical protein ANN_10811 [Periplaneta americana]|uniref:Tc1-like transposase DDE domain-containing protein n=1 Tax=Periplaneta americana TaxID=6978 RepID=A0ABQ8T515_PERAM|nr:hypothetical protein ANN_10811 [Periplaneta americana]